VEIRFFLLLLPEPLKVESLICNQLAESKLETVMRAGISVEELNFDVYFAENKITAIYKEKFSSF
jgi:hypothetical protein